MKNSSSANFLWLTAKQSFGAKVSRFMNMWLHDFLQNEGLGTTLSLPGSWTEPPKNNVAWTDNLFHLHYFPALGFEQQGSSIYTRKRRSTRMRNEWNLLALFPNISGFRRETTQFIQHSEKRCFVRLKSECPDREIRMGNTTSISFELQLALTYPKRGILQLIAQKQSASKEREGYVKSKCLNRQLWIMS